MYLISYLRICKSFILPFSLILKIFAMFHMGFLSDTKLFVSASFFQCHKSITEIEYIKPNTAHMALQIPQYFFITAGEVMFSVTGLEFSYSQVREAMSLNNSQHLHSFLT